MKALTTLLTFMLLATNVMAAPGKLQNEDFKTPAQLTGAGLPLSKLLNDTKIWVTANGVNTQLSTAITNGVIGGAGSGGGGINLLDLNGGNSNAEKTVLQLTNSGGTLTRQTTNPLDGTGSFQFASTASGQYVDSTAIAVPAGFAGRKCQVHFPLYTSNNATSATTDFDVQVIDGNGNTLVDRAIPVTSSPTTATVFQAFDCPATGVTLKYRVINVSGTAGTIVWDDAFLGQGRNTINSFGPFVTDWAPYTATLTNLGTNPGQSLQFRRVGSSLQIRGSVTVGTSPPASVISVSLPLYNGTSITANVPSTQIVGTGAGSVASSVVYTAIVANGSSAFNIGFQNTNSAGSTPQTASAITAGVTVFFDEISFPITGWIAERAPVEGNTFDTVGWRVDAIQSGTSNVNLGTVAVTTPTNPGTAGLTVTNAPAGVNLQSAQQTCSTGGPSSNATCASGTPSVGIAFNVPIAGDVKVCAQFVHVLDAGSTSGMVQDFFKLAETNPSSTSIIQDGKYLTSAGHEATNLYSVRSHSVCDTFAFASAGQHAIRLFYTQTASGGTFDAVTIGASGVTIKWTVEPLNQSIPAPVFNSILSKVESSSTNWRVEAASIAGNTCAIVSQTGFIASTTVNNTNNSGCVLTFVPGKFSVGPICSVTNYSTGAFYSCMSDGQATTTSMGTYCVNSGGTPAAASRYVICMGPK